MNPIFHRIRQLVCLVLIAPAYCATGLLGQSGHIAEVRPILLPDSLADSSSVVRVNYFSSEGYKRYVDAPDSALMYFKRAETEAVEADDSTSMLKTIFDMGHFMMSRGINGPALEYINIGEKLALTLLDSNKYVFFQYWKSRIYNELGDFDRSMEACKEAMSMENDSAISGWALSYYGESLRGAGFLERARDTLHQALVAFRAEDDPIGYIMSSAKLAKVYVELRQPDQVREHAKSVMHYWKRVGGYESFLNIHCSLVDVDLMEGNLDSAEHRGLYALEQVEGKKYYRPMIELAKKMVTVYEQKGNFERALFYTRMAHGLEEEFELNKVEINLAVKDAEYLNERLQNQNDLLKEQKKGQLYLTLGLGAVLLLAILLVIFQVRSNNRTRKFNKVLQYKNLDLDEKNAALDRLNQEKDMLMQIVAHDLKSPLNSVRGLTGIVRDEGGLTEMQTKVLGKMDTVVERGLGLIHNLLDLSAMENGKMELRPAEFDPAHSLEKIVSEYTEKAERKSISIELSTPGTASSLTTDPVLYERIVDNLLSNAVKYSPHGKRVWVSLHKAGNEFHTTVRDEGPGISEQDQKRLFGKFERLSASPTGGETSNGLGLAIVKSLAQQLGGKIQVRSALGEGAEFSLVMPLRS